MSRPSAAPALVDSHAHLTFAGLVERLPEVLHRAREAGVTRILTVSAELGDAARVVRLAAEHVEHGVLAAIGVHPHEASGYDDAREAEIERLAADPAVVAIGETGLDFHYDHSPRDVQERVFRRQVRLARRVGLPVIVHSREAEPETARILEDEGVPEVGGVLHCFTSSWWLAQRGIDLGLAISLSGIVTFRNADDLRDVARRIPADRLLVETDSPYLAPEPFRGRGPNEPARVRTVAESVAGTRGTTLDEIARLTTANFARTFDPP